MFMSVNTKFFALTCLAIEPDMGLILPILEANKRNFDIIEIGIYNSLSKLHGRNFEERKRIVFEEIYPYLSPRKMKGLLRDPYIIKMIGKRLEAVSPRKRRKPTKTQRIRGYRDHGTYIEPHQRGLREANTLKFEGEKLALQELFFQELLSDDLTTRVTAFSRYTYFLQKIGKKDEERSIKSNGGPKSSMTSES